MDIRWLCQNSLTLSHQKLLRSVRVTSGSILSLHSSSENDFSLWGHLHLYLVISIPYHVFSSSVAEEQTTPNCSGWKPQSFIIFHDPVSWLWLRLVAPLTVSPGFNQAAGPSQQAQLEWNVQDGVGPPRWRLSPAAVCPFTGWRLAPKRKGKLPVLWRPGPYDPQSSLRGILLVSASQKASPVRAGKPESTSDGQSSEHIQGKRHRRGTHTLEII